MPEYLAPGIFVDETSGGSHRIERASTSTAAFIGPTSFGPIDAAPRALLSLADFESVYDPFSAGRRLSFAGSGEAPNFMWHAARAFFEEGGKRLHVCRVFKPLPESATSVDGDGHARVDPDKTGSVTIRARFPGAVGRVIVRLSLESGRSVFVDSVAGSAATFRSLREFDLVRIRTPHLADRLSIAHWHAARRVWRLEAQGIHQDATSPVWLEASELEAGSTVHVETLAVGLRTADGSHEFVLWSHLPLDPRHRSAVAGDSVFARFADRLSPGAGEVTPPLVFTCDDGRVVNAFDVIAALRLSVVDQLIRFGKPAHSAHVDVHLEGGSDGLLPGASEYEGGEHASGKMVLGLRQLEGIDDISIVAAPGSSWSVVGGNGALGEVVQALLVAHAVKTRYRVALLDSAPGQSISAVLAMRAKLDSESAALYYPWIRSSDPVRGGSIDLPPSGFAAGICARVDAERGVWVAPANEVVRLAIGVDTPVDQAQQNVLNPEGINCFRAFAGRGLRLWGARTVSSNPEWKYLHVRRYAAYLEDSIVKGTRWVVFEANGESLWAELRARIESFLFGEWRRGALLGDSAANAFFVRCDRTTITQNDLDNGRVLCLVGVAAVRPGEFLSFRIGQRTAEEVR